MRARIFGTDAQPAHDYVQALGGSSAYTDGGRPRLPRCDSVRGKGWTDPDVKQGAACPECACTARAAPDASCDYCTKKAAAVWKITAGARDGDHFVVEVDGRTPDEGEVIDGVDLSPSLMGTLSQAEWDSRELVETPG